MDLGDRDLGSGGISLPDLTTFSRTGVERMAITCGKSKGVLSSLTLDVNK
jgi:hypothetical protein